MSFLNKLLRRRDPKDRMATLYAAIVARGREPHWYATGGVSDTIDGRFDMIACILALVLLRLEQLGAPQEEVWLTETFIDDMDGQLRQIGIGDLLVGKHVGRMMGALGGRIGAYRAALAGKAPMEEALVRNLYRGEAPDSQALTYVAERLQALWAGLQAVPRDALVVGALAP